MTTARLKPVGVFHTAQGSWEAIDIKFEKEDGSAFTERVFSPQTSGWLFNQLCEAIDVEPPAANTGEYYTRMLRGIFKDNTKFVECQLTKRTFNDKKTGDTVERDGVDRTVSPVFWKPAQYNGVAEEDVFAGQDIDDNSLPF